MDVTEDIRRIFGTTQSKRTIAPLMLTAYKQPHRPTQPGEVKLHENDEPQNLWGVDESAPDPDRLARRDVR